MGRGLEPQRALRVSQSNRPDFRHDRRDGAGRQCRAWKPQCGRSVWGLAVGRPVRRRALASEPGERACRRTGRPERCPGGNQRGRRRRVGDRQHRRHGDSRRSNRVVEGAAGRRQRAERDRGRRRRRVGRRQRRRCSRPNRSRHRGRDRDDPGRRSSRRHRRRRGLGVGRRQRRRNGHADRRHDRKGGCHDRRWWQPAGDHRLGRASVGDGRRAHDPSQGAH